MAQKEYAEIICVPAVFHGNLFKVVYQVLAKSWVVAAGAVARRLGEGIMGAGKYGEITGSGENTPCVPGEG